MDRRPARSRPRIRPSAWSGPCVGLPIVLICGRRWRGVRSASIVPKPSRGSPRTSGTRSTWMWPECDARRRCTPGSVQRPNIGPPSTSSWLSNPRWTNPGGSYGEVSRELPGHLVDKVLSESADELPALPDGARGDSSWRKAIALAELCVGQRSPTRPAHRVRRRHPRLRQQRTCRRHAGSRAQDWPRSTGSHPLRPGHRSDRPSSKTAPPWSTGDRSGPSHPPCAGRSSTATTMFAPPTAVPAPAVSKSTMSSPGVEGGTNRPRQPDHTVLVPPSDRRPPTEASGPTATPNTDGSDSEEPDGRHQSSSHTPLDPTGP